MKMSRIESGIRLVMEFNDAFNRHDVRGLVQFMSDDCTCESSSPAPDGERYIGKEVVTRYWQEFFSQHPQIHNTIEQIFGIGVYCVMRWRSEWLDVAGNTVHLRGVHLFQVRNELICEMLSYVKG